MLCAECAASQALPLAHLLPHSAGLRVQPVCSQAELL